MRTRPAPGRARTKPPASRARTRPHTAAILSLLIHRFTATRNARAAGVLCTVKMSRFIDTGLLVDAVQCKPCLWDVSNCNYKNKDAVARAWEDICDEMFEGLSQEEKPKIGK